MANILVVDDDPTVREVVVSYLRAHGHTVIDVGDGESALELNKTSSVDLAVLDLMLPGIDGIEVCQRLREEQPDLPVVMLTALDSESDRISGLRRGADDYVTKPFSPRELALRVDSILRRIGVRPEAHELVDGDLHLDPVRHQASRGGDVLALTAREFALLRFFIAHAGQAFTREELLNHVWGWNFGDSSTVTVHVRRLREKVETNPTEPQRLVTVWGVGYRWEAR